ncbi:hypothetical protein [Actinocorallia longicatena]|uniref:XRE family transcriptional regulator n=1 Tax=Actinocorallia longicatena TaxID=111803 RepID=A0ABP6QG90_9ACTN
MAGRESQQPRTVLEFLLRQQDHTYEELVREFSKVARQLDERGVSISARHLRRLASGERAGTTPATRRVLQTMFGLSVSDLLRPFDPAAAAPNPADTIENTQTQSDVERLMTAAERSREFAMSRHLPVSAEGVEELADEIMGLAQTYLVTPLPNLLGRLISAQESVFSQLELRQKPANARQLYFLATIVGGMLGYAAHDLGKPHVALSHTRTAFMWAEYADHNGLRAWIRGLQSLICFWTGQPREAVRYALAGTEFASTARTTSAPWLYACQARAHAALGDAAQAKAMIERATQAQDQVVTNDLDEFGGICSFLPARQTYYAARTLASLPGESANAERYALEAIEMYTDQNQAGWDFSCQADSFLSLALAQARSGEIEGAAASLRPVLDLPPEQRISELNTTMNLVHGALNQRTPHRQALEIQEEIELFTRVSLPGFPV